MHSRRLTPPAAELENVLYVSGRYDGVSYSSSVEMLDPRENSWLKLPNMNTRKGCHLMVVLNEKLYAVGGFDGDKHVEKVECLDTRMGGWVETEAMNVCRGTFWAFVVGEKLYAIGGFSEFIQPVFLLQELLYVLVDLILSCRLTIFYLSFDFFGEQNPPNNPLSV